MRLDRVIGEDLAHCPLGEFGHTGVAGGGPPITGLRGQRRSWKGRVKSVDAPLVS